MRAAEDGSGPSTPKKPATKKPSRKFTPPPPKPSTSSISGSADSTPRGYGSSKPIQASRPTYVSPPKPKKERVVDTSSFSDTLNRIKNRGADPIPVQGSKSSNDLGDFLRGIRSGGRGITKPTPEPESRELSTQDSLKYLLDPDSRDEAASPLEAYSRGIKDEELKNFLKRVRPSNFDPEYGGVTMPEAWRHKGKDVNNPLKPFFDEEFIQKNILGGLDPNNKYDRTEIKDRLNEVLYQQLQTQSNWLRKRTADRARNVSQFLYDAGQDAFEGDFTTLGKKLEENPDYLEFARYRDEFTKTPADIWREWYNDQSDIKDPYLRAKYGAEVKIRAKHLSYVQKLYTDSRRKVNRAIKDYEKKYNDAVEHHDADDAGPAIPEITEAQKQEQAAQEMRDKVGNQSSAFIDFSFMGVSDKDAKRLNRQRLKEQRNEAKEILGVKQLPKVKEMLTALVASGQVDPDNEAEVDAWIKRLKNPNHPDTRALYTSFAKQVNKKLDDEKALEWVNAPINEFIKGEEERAKINAEHQAEEDEAKNNALMVGLGLGMGPVGKPMDKARALEWTFDKLSRLNYGVAGASGAWYALDEDSTVLGNPWPTTAATMFSDPLRPLTGRSLYDSVDEALDDPSKVVDVVHEGYSQVFRGSNLPGIKKNVVPTTFSHVIAQNAMTDDRGDIYDKEWFQHVAGFALDVATDPLNLIGVGVVDDTLKVPARISKAMAASRTENEATTAVDEFLRGISNPNLSAAAEKAWRVQQVSKMLGDEVTLSGPQLVPGDQVVPFSIHTVNDESYVKRANHVPTHVSDDTYTIEGAVDRLELQQQFADLQALERSVADDIGATHYEAQLNKIADELDFNLVSVPQLTVQKLLARTSRPVRMKDVPTGTPAVDSLGAKFYEKIIKPLMDQDVIRDWSGRSSVTRYATITDQNGKRLTGRAAAAKRAIDEENQIYAYASANHIDPEKLITSQMRERWDRALDQAGDYDDVIGSPHIWEDYNVDEYLDAGAPGLLDGSFNPYDEFASASGDPAAFKQMFSETDVFKALWYGPKMHAADNAAAKASLQEGFNRIADAQRKLAQPGLKPEVRAATYKALALGIKQVNENTLAGAFRYLDTLKSSSGVVAAKQIDEDISKLDDLLDEANEELAKNIGSARVTQERFIEGEKVGEDLLEIDPGIGYLGGETVDSFGQVTPFYNGTYDGFDFVGVSFKDVYNSIDVGSFSSPASRLESMIDAINAQKAELAVMKRNKVTALNPVEAAQVNSILSPRSSFRKADGSIDAEKVKNHLSHNKEEFNDKKQFKVSYKPPREKPKEGTPERAIYDSEVRFLAKVKDFVEDRANSLYRQEKTKLLKAKEEKAPVNPAVQDVQDRMSTFWTERDGQRMGPAERKLGPRPTPESLRKKYPNYFSRQVHDRKGTKPAGFKDEIVVDKETGLTERKLTWQQAGPKTAKQRKLEALIKGQQKAWDAKAKRAREIDSANYAKLKDELKSANTTNTFKLTSRETGIAYRLSYKRALDEALADINAGIIKNTNANATLSVGDQARMLEKQFADQFKYEQTQLRIRELEATNADELADIQRAKKALEARRERTFQQIKVAKREAQTVRATMKIRITEEHILQAMNMPERLTGRMMQLRIMGMRKNLQFTHNMFNGMKVVEALLPTSVYTNFANNWYRPSKQFRAAESIALRARYESKTPVVVRAHLERLNKAMTNTTESERSGIMLSIRKDMPYAGPKQAEYHAIRDVMDDMMKIINGTHEHHMFVPLGAVKAESLSIYEILRFLPKEYSFSPKVLHRFEADRIKTKGRKNVVKEEREPFSQAPEPRGEATLDDLLSAIESNGLATPKDLADPFRVAWVYNLAADQASQLRGFKKTLSETFGVPAPEKGPKYRAWRQLITKAGWKEHRDLPGVAFPPEIIDEVDKLLKLTEPGKESTAAMKMFDNAIGYWKQGMTIYNPAYYTRNGIGEMMVSWLDGVNSPKWYAMAHKVHRFERKEGQELSELIRKFDGLKGRVSDESVKNNEVLFKLNNGTKVRVEDALMWYIETGLKATFVNTDIGQGLRGLATTNLSKNPVRKALNKTNTAVHEAGEGFEDWLRMAHFLHAMQNSGKGTLREAAEYAATRVRRSHFDYTDFSNFEKTVMLRAFPFYKWVRRGAPLMMAHLFMTPGKMAALPKALDTMSGLGFDPLNMFNDDPVFSTSDVLEDKNGHLPDYQGIAPAWVRDLFAYQMQPAEDDEYANYLRISTPQVDGLQGITDFIDSGITLAQGDPMGALAELGNTPMNTLLNPAVKAPLELGMNTTLDPDSNFEIYGGEYNENMGISDGEAVGAYLARQANPWTNFLAKLSKNGKLPIGNISDQEGGRDATRDVASFLTGIGFYQAKPEKELTTSTPKSDLVPNSSAVGSFELSDLTMFPDAAVGSNSTEKETNKSIESVLKDLQGSGADTTTGTKYSKNYKRRYRRGYRGYGGYGGYGGSSYSSSSWDLMALLKRLKDQIDQGDVINLQEFED